MYVADAHAWIYYLLGKLPENIKDIFTRTENFEEIIFLPTIALNETIWLAEKDRISVNIREMLSKLEEPSNFIIVPLDFAVTKKVAEIKFGELHDRIIISTTKMLNAILITKDEKIIRSCIVNTIW